MLRTLARLSAIITIACSLTAAPAFASSHSSGSHTSHSTSSKSKSKASSKSKSSTAHRKSTSAKRDANGRIARSEAAKHQFEVQTGYSHGRPGYVIDHIKPLACGGADAPSNMQWQTIEAAKLKDKTERVGCR
jgi:hypothetical protein